ncbi:MAG TPA: amino acid adenylation domain-containing protein, partial [Longimicrobiaceae bacterium]
LIPWLQELQARVGEMRQFEHTPLVQVHGWSEVPRDTPLFESLLVFENYPDAGGGRGEPGGLEVGGAHAFERSSYPLTLVAGAGREMVLRLVYDTRRFERASVQGILDRLRRLLEGIAADPRRSLADLPLLTEAERERVVREWNDTATDFPRDASVHALFEAQARRTPDAPALRYGAASMSYGELDRTANRLAALLRARGAAPGDRVGVLLEPRVEGVTAWLAALKSGCAYVPLDPAHPRERLALLLRDAGVRLAVTRDAHRPLLAGEGVAAVSVDGDAAEIAAQPADGECAPVPAEALAYVVYTSGSTGTPKGVAVPHRAVVRLVAATDYVRLAPDDRVAQASTPVFDAATWEVWGALLAGASLVGIDRDTALDPRALARELRERDVTALFLTTALFNQVAREVPGAFGGVRHLLFGGEAVDPDAVRRVLADRRPARLLHVYGPTESTTFATWHEVREVAAGAATVPIGRALADTTAYVADAAYGPVPAGVPGELLLGGEGLAWGYLGRPDLTADRFVPDPFSAEPGARLYRTGDRVRWSADGALEFLGRIDQQVKIRGFRIEPGEVEAVLRDLPDVRDAAVVVREDAPGERRLAAYLVPAAGVVGFDPGAAREALRARLPEYMVPSAWTVLDALPLTATGKTDRRALPAPEAGAGEARVAPRTPTEEAVSAVWAEVLRVESPGAHDRFFDLGGHSLLATQVISRVRDRLGVDLPIRALFEASTVAAFAARIDAARGEGAAPAPPETRRGRGVGGRQPLSFAQQRLWFLDQLEPGSPAYNVLRALRLHGPLDPAALRRALEEVVRRHDALRTTFAAVPGGAVQVVDAEARVALPVAELRALPGGAGERELLRLVEAEGRVPFDLARGPLLRALLLRPADGEWVLSLVVHHVVADGWSLGVLVRELSEAYSARVRGEAPRLPPVEVQYPEFAARQREWLEAGVAEAQLAFWRARLAGAPPLLELPVDRPRPPAQSTRGTSVEVVLPVEVSRRLRELARAAECTLFMTLLAGFQVLLGRYAGEDDVCVGTPVAGRTRSDVEGTIGFFANTLVLRTDLGGDPDARELLRRVRETTLAAFENQDVPFERVVEELQPERSRAHDPVFQAMFALQNLDVGRLELEGVRVEALEQPVPAVKFDLNLALRDDGEQIVGGLEFRTDLWDVESALRMVEHLSALLAGMAADPDRPLSELDLLDDAGRAHLLALGDGGPPVPAEAPDLAGLFEAQALRTPEAEAVAAPDGALTYAELDARSAGLARRLRALGAGPESRVGVCLERGLDMAVAVLAALRAGAAYVPLDPRYPAERLAYMLRDADAQVLLTQERLLARLPEHGAETVLADAEWKRPVEDGPGVPAGPDSLAYVVYTSGSTGTPKGVAMPRGPLGALVAWQLREWGAGAPARTLQFASLSFDVSFQEMLTTWASGGTLVLLAEEERADLAAVLRRIEAERVERVFLPFVALQHLAELGDRHAVHPASLREVVTAGEQLRVTPQLARWMGRLGGCSLVNQYGPSETHVVTSFALEGAPEGWPALPPIGRPVAGVRAYVLDRRLRPAPTGVPGELYLGGAPVARGYLGRPAATAERFLPDPFAAEPGARMYRTGDRVRWRADGELEFLGRVDQQVKVRGFRVEPGEVEAALERHPAVREAAVVAREDDPGDRFLAAYWAGDADAETLRGWLRGRLPEHMVPSAWTRVERLPLTPSGKIDRRSLPAPERAGGAERRVAPRTPAEEALAAIWREVLKTERVGVHDGFFELGGHSLLATQVVSRVREALGVEVPVAALFDHPTVEGLARVVEEARAAQPSPADRIVPIARQARRGVRSPGNVILK